MTQERAAQRDSSEKPYRYKVTRLERIVYFVESDEPIEQIEHIWRKLTHPYSTSIESETIQQVKP